MSTSPSTSHSHKNVLDSSEDYGQPPGPPPSHRQTTAPEAESESEPPPYDLWLAVPDSALLAPPPSIREERSPTSNASTDDSERAHAWCLRNPLWARRRLNQQTITRMADGDVGLTAPPIARQLQLTPTGVGRTRVKTSSRCIDMPLLSGVPLYSAATEQPRTIYCEVKFSLWAITMCSGIEKRMQASLSGSLHLHILLGGSLAGIEHDWLSMETMGAAISMTVSVDWTLLPRFAKTMLLE